ncbi:hypothetical protein H4S01_002925 [Coemansia sp. RSA 2610]|nr:hypothetical protein H4S01_002925 [Coemansia sp. RSA 2610]
MTATAEIDIGTSVEPLLPSTALDTVGTNLERNSSLPYQFIDYRVSSLADSTGNMPPIVRQIVEGLTTLRALPGNSAKATRSLPTVLLYDDAGLDYFDRITYLPEYYLTACEIEILQTHIEAIVAEIPDGSDVIELGCGSLRKTELLLDALDKRRTAITYYAIDVMPQPLHESMAKLAAQFANVSLCALCGTYDEVLPRLTKSERPKTVLWLGSSIGNYHSPDAVEFLKKISQSVLAANDALIIGMDKQKQTSIIMDAYHDSQGVTAEFELNILTHINRLVGEYAAQQGDTTLPASATGLFDTSAFRYVGVYDEQIGRHDAYLEACVDTEVSWPHSIVAEVKEICGSDSNVAVRRGERIYIESAYKYSDSAAEVLAQTIGLTFSAEWTESRDYYTLNLFRKPQAAMPLVSQTIPVSFDKWSIPAHRASTLRNTLSNSSAPEQFPTIPSVDEWTDLWAVWDTLTLHVLARKKLLVRPIDLRHPFIFYLGHIPAFADIHMAAAESAPLSEPAVFAQWFERGIDPNMEDPTICHNHSEVPDEWPSVDKITAYRDRVRRRITAWVDGYYAANSAVSADAARHVWMAFEHEAMHIETLLYMVLQMDPADIRSPAISTFGLNSSAQPARSWISYSGSPAAVLGLTADSETALGAAALPTGHVFGWDNESPSMSVAIKPFRIHTQPITNSEYLGFLKAISSGSARADGELDDLIPQSWVALSSSQGPTGNKLLDADYGVRAAVGTPSISKTEAALWPVCVSQAQAEAYASWCGKRLPTEAEWTYATRSYHLARALSANAPNLAYSSAMPVDKYLGELLAAQDASGDAHACQPYDMFAPTNANIGLSHWHPTPVPTTPASPDCLPEASFIGSAWEWTSTPFHPFDGFKPSPMYPGYSADFFDPPETHGSDSAHYIVKGGSYITHPRIALRQTFRNWYQRGYPYVLATFRLCEDASL